MNNDNSDNGRVRSLNYNGDYSFISCITWTSVTTGNFACRFSPKGFLFDAAGPICKAKCNEDIYLILGLLTSCVAKYYLKVINPTINFHPGYIMAIPFSKEQVLKYREKIDGIVKQNISISLDDWNTSELSWDFMKHSLVQKVGALKQAHDNWTSIRKERFEQLKSNEEQLNKIFIEIYGLTEELNPEIENSEVAVNLPDLKNDIRGFISYAVGCMFGRYSLDVEGIAYAGNEWDSGKYKTFVPDKDNCIPITDEEYFGDDIVARFVEFVKNIYGIDTLEENLDFTAKALGNKGNTSKEILRNYFVKDFYKDHIKTYKKCPIYWLYDSGKQDGFKALVYIHRYTADTTGIVRVDYLHKMQKIYMSEIDRMKEMAENSRNTRDVAQAEKRREKLIKQLKETKEYDEKIAHLALSRIAIDLDDGVKVNYEKVQTGQDGKKLDILAKI